MKLHLLKRCALTLLLVYSAALVADLCRQPHALQWDFKTYYYAARAWTLGLNPYDLKALSQLAGTRLYFPYVYPSLTLALFWPFTLLPFQGAYYVYLAVKLAALAGLLWLWKRTVLKEETDTLFYYFVLFAFSNSLYIDFRAGNISVFEQLLLWTGFACFLRGRLLPFCACIVAAGLFKVTPAAFLFLLPFSGHRRKYGYLAGSLALFAGLLLASYAMMPGQAGFGVDNAGGGLTEHGANNPCTLAFIQEITTILAVRIPGAVPDALPFALYAAALLLVGIPSLAAYRRLGRVETADRDRILLFLGLVVYGLLVPRFKCYSYILLIPPAYFLLKRIRFLPVHALAPLAFMIPTAGTLSLPGTGAVLRYLADYQPMFQAYVLWLLYLAFIYRTIAEGLFPLQPINRGLAGSSRGDDRAEGRPRAMGTPGGVPVGEDVVSEAVIAEDWGRMPAEDIHPEPTPAGGIIEGTVSEATVVHPTNPDVAEPAPEEASEESLAANERE
jgi:glycosyl transferase family 87